MENTTLVVVLDELKTAVIGLSFSPKELFRRNPTEDVVWFRAQSIKKKTGFLLPMPVESSCVFLCAQSSFGERAKDANSLPNSNFESIIEKNKSQFCVSIV